MNSTQHNSMDVFRNVSDGVNELFYNIISFEIFFLNLLWAIYFIYKIAMEKKYQKQLIEKKVHLRPDDWITKSKNSQRKLIKLKFLLAISFLEWIIIFIMSQIILFNFFKDIAIGHPAHFPKFKLNIDININIVPIYANISEILVQYVISFVITLYLFIICLLRILTVYLLDQYQFYSSTWKFCPVFTGLAIRLVIFSSWDYHVSQLSFKGLFYHYSTHTNLVSTCVRLENQI